jgi:hypothetical protein
MSHQGLMQPDGRIRRDAEALSIVAAALRDAAEITELVESIESQPAAAGSFGLLIPARLRSDGRIVLVKVNANSYERAWLPAIGRVDAEIVPEVFGSGDSIGSVPVGWMVVERLPYQPPGFGGPEWYGPLMAAAFRWHAAALRVDVAPWHAIDGPWLIEWMERGIAVDGSHNARLLRERFDDDWLWVADVCPPEPCHGDVHFFNAGSRTTGLPDTFVLFDPIPRSAPWPFEYANCQTLTNYATVVPDGSPLVVLAAHDRRRRGLPTPDDADVLRLSDLFCAWLSLMWRGLFHGTQPARKESSARYVDRALRGAR